MTSLTEVYAPIPLCEALRKPRIATMTSLMKLSAELRLSIIEYLEPPRIPHKPSSSGHQRRHETSLKDNGLEDLLNLSCVNRDFRTLVAAYLFKSVTLRNTEKSAASLRLIADSAYASRVRTIHYAPLIDDLLPCMSDDEIENGPFEDPPPAQVQPEQFPETVKDVLGNLSRSSRLERLTVEFVITDEKLIGFHGVFNLLARPREENEFETQDEVREAEAREGWRALMNQSYEAISRNAPGTVTSLELRNVVLKEVSAWRDPAWSAFLRGVEDFALTLRGWEDGVGGCLTVHQEYPNLIQNLDVYFFNHLENATRFRFEATADGAVGCEGTYLHINFPFRDVHMPKLRHLHLAYVFLSKQLLNAIRGHKDTLETVLLTDCLALDTTEYVESLRNTNEVSWAQFFDDIREAKMSRLKQFVVDWMDSPKDVYHWDHYIDALEDFGGPGKRGFLYGTLDDRYGSFYMDEEKVVDRHKEGEDSRAWLDLVKWLEGNSMGR